MYKLRISKDKEGIIFIRSTSIISDSRVLKEADTALKCGFRVLILGWNREKRKIDTPNLKLNNGIAELKLFNVKCGYGDGFKSLPKLIIFQFWILYSLFIKRKQYSIMHSCDFDCVIPCFLVKKMFNKKLIYDIFDYYIHSRYIPDKIQNIVERIDIGIINSSDAIIICIEERYKQIEKSSPKRVEVIHNSPNYKFIKSSIKLCKSSNEKLKIVYIGILQKNRLLIEISELIGNYTNIELHIGGFGYFENYFKALSEKSDNIYYYGQLNYSDVLQLESECDILFATYNPQIMNHRFSAPNKLYEAMALKKPVIVCTNTGVDELINRYNMGLSIDYKAEEFFRIILILQENLNMRIKMGQNGRNAYDEMFSWNIMERKLSALYLDLK